MAREIALVTGASSGIGEALARRLARDGRNLGLVARRAERLEALASELRAGHRIEVDVLPADLIQPGAVAALVAELGRRGLDVDWLVNNAGFGTSAAFTPCPSPASSRRSPSTSRPWSSSRVACCRRWYAGEVLSP
jgi:short-subunit dehydrogenase